MEPLPRQIHVQHDLLDKFNNAVEIVEEHGGNIVKHTTIEVNEYPEGSMTNKEQEQAITRAKEKFLS
eukprot:14003275-Ditylum_brightwellii.AAC.1